MKAMIHPEKDLAGATPETLALALLRAGKVRKPVVGDKVAKQKVTPDKSGNRGPHLRKGT